MTENTRRDQGVPSMGLRYGLLAWGLNTGANIIRLILFAFYALLIGGAISQGMGRDEKRLGADTGHTILRGMGRVFCATADRI